MITTSRKIVAGLLSSAMVLTLVVGLSTTASAAYTRSLTIGSRGADVTELQTTLAAAGYLTVSPTGYFGTLTQRALAKWQASVGISPASGYFGPITRAYIASNGSTGGNTGSTGGTPGCPAGAMYNYMTGALCSTGGTTSTTEGSLTLANSAAVTTNANIQTNVDVPVWGVQLRAQLAPVTVSRIDLGVMDNITGGTSYENPGNFINTIKVWDGSTLVKSWSVGTADFLTGTTSNDYYVRLSNLNYTVPANTSKDLVVSFSTNGGIDTARALSVYGYGTNSLLSTSGNNINSYYNVAGYSFVQTFKKPGNSTLSIGVDASNPASGSNYVDPISGATGITTLAWNAAAANGDAKITSVSVTVNSSGSVPSGVYLYDGANRIAGQGVSSNPQTVVFNNLSVTVPSGTTKVFTVKVDESSSATTGSTASTTVSAVSYQTASGNTQTASGSVTGNAQAFYGASANLQFVSAAPVTSVSPCSTCSASSLGTTFTLKVHPQGGQMLKPQASDFTVVVGTTTAAQAYITATTNIGSIMIGSTDVTSSSNNLSANSDYTITLNASVATSSLPTGTAYYTFFLKTASTTVFNTVGAPVSSSLTTGLDAFRTGSYLFTK